MAKIIEFYIPARYKPKHKWTPPSQRGKLLEFKKKDAPIIVLGVPSIPGVFLLT